MSGKTVVIAFVVTFIFLSKIAMIGEGRNTN